MLKANEPIFVYVIMQTINKKYIDAGIATAKKELWGTKLHWVGKGMGLRGWEKQII
jgi:hypothetical protein